MSKKILIIDDEEDVVEIIKTTLKTKGYQTIHAYDGEEGLKQALVNQPDLIILDLMMPKMSGLELTKRLRRDEKTRDIPIIVMSALGKDTGKPEEFWRDGLKVNEFLSKPFDTFDLLGRVETIFRSKNYVSVRQNQAGAGPSEGEEEPIDLVSASPADVVKMFVESWNRRAFALEYDCLHPSLQVLPRQEYVRNRTQTWLDEQKAGVTQQVTEVLSEQIDGDNCQVIIKRSDTRQGRSLTQHQAFDLTRIPEGWKITHMKTLK
ncbi:MAG: hypothetical protein Kow0059_02440 [Candidatus Sumerlaeia bacterium]